MRIFFSGIVAIAVLAQSVAAKPKPTEVERALQTSAGTQASFLQRFTPAGFKNQQVERGIVVFGPAPKMRWSYTDPEPKTFVFDGTTSWLYSPADRQVTVTVLDETEKRQIPFVLISDPAGLQRHFTVQERRKGGSIEAQIRPRDRSASVREVFVTIDPASHQIRTLSYIDRQGNRTVFEFSNYRKAAPSDLAFRFVPPPGVDVVENHK